MGVPCSARNREGVLDSADIHLARMGRVPDSANMFVDGSFVANLIFCNQIVGVNFQCSIFIRAGTQVNAKLCLAPSELHLR